MLKGYFTSSHMLAWFEYNLSRKWLKEKMALETGIFILVVQIKY